MAPAAGILLVLAGLGGCATQPPENLKPVDWHGKTVTRAESPAGSPIWLSVTTTGVGMLAGAWGFSDWGQIAKGRQLALQNDIESPGNEVGRDLFKAAQKRYGVAAAPAPVIPASSLDDPAELERVAAGADFVLIVRSGAGITYRILSPRHYNVVTSSQARLISVPTGKTIAISDCGWTSGDEPTPPTYDELFANHAARLKAYLATQGHACVQTFLTELFGSGP